MRNGATTLPTTPAPAGQPADRPAGPPPGPRSAGLPPTAPLLRRAPRVRRAVDLEASCVVNLTVTPTGGPTPGAPVAEVLVAVLDERELSIQDRIRLRAQEAAAGA